MEKIKEVERKAFLMALKAHAHQLYGENEPYIVHLQDVVSVLHRFPHLIDETLLAAAWLHDIIEDTPNNYHNVVEECGESVAKIVYAVTDELGHNRRERKAKSLPKLANFIEAQTLKLADWIANLEESHRSDLDKIKMYKKDWPELMQFRGDFIVLEPMWKAVEDLVLGENK